MRDDPAGIPDSTRLLRRISPIQVVHDANRGETRPSSQNFQDSADGTPMSVFAENVLLGHSGTAHDLLKGRWESWGIVALPAGWMRACGQIVYLDPQNQDSDDWHASHAAVEGRKDPKTRKRLGERYEWVIKPKD